jgi:hypothetical protein
MALPTGLPRIPLEGQGPWSLVEVADAAGVPYETVYRDVRAGRLSCQRVDHQYRVAAVDLGRAARGEYRRLVAAAPRVARPAIAPTPSTARAERGRALRAVLGITDQIGAAAAPR